MLTRFDETDAEQRDPLLRWPIFLAAAVTVLFWTAIVCAVAFSQS